MFCGGYKKKIEALEAELAEARQPLSAVEGEGDAARQAQAETEERLSRMSGDLDRCQRIYLTMQSFGDSSWKSRRRDPGHHV